MLEHINVYNLYNYSQIRDLAHGVKNGNRTAIETAAKVYIAMVTDFYKPEENSVIIPMVGHNGMATYNKDIAEIVSKECGVQMMLGLECVAHKPLYDVKLQNPNREVKLPTMIMTKDLQGSKWLRDEMNIMIIDNVMDTGSTAMAAKNAMGQGYKLLVLGHTQNYTKYGYPFVMHRPLRNPLGLPFESNRL